MKRLRYVVLGIVVTAAAAFGVAVAASGSDDDPTTVVASPGDDVATSTPFLANDGDRSCNDDGLCVVLTGGDDKEVGLGITKDDEFIRSIRVNRCSANLLSSGLTVNNAKQDGSGAFHGFAPPAPTLTVGGQRLSQVEAVVDVLGTERVVHAFYVESDEDLVMAIREAYGPYFGNEQMPQDGECVPQGVAR